MAKKTYLDNSETQKRVRKGISDLADIVGKTLGPGGRPILLQQENRPPLSTKDGVTVARYFKARGDVEDVVADAAREVCERTNRSCGDGTTTAIVLASALVSAGQERLAAREDYSPQRLARELKELYEKKVRPSILAIAKEIKNLPAKEAKEVIRQVALVSANHDVEIANAVAEAVEFVGEDGMINAEEGVGSETRVVQEQGFPFDSGLSDLGTAAGASFINRKDRSDCFVEGAYVALYDGEIVDPNTVVPLMNKVLSELDESGHQLKHPLIVFAHGFSDQVLRMMAQNFRQGVLTVVPVKTSSNGQNLARSLFLHDVAAYVGGIVHDAQGSPLQSAALASLGFVESMKLSQSNGVLLGRPDQDAVEQRISELKSQMEGATEFDKSKIRYRVGRLTGGIATIYAGGATALEAKERYARVVDAISAVRSAMELGVVPGGGCTLLHIADTLEPAETEAEHIFAQALRSPFSQILDNAGMEVDANQSRVGPQETKEGHVSPFFVVNALTGQLGDWWEMGIMDPAKVTVTALENALSVSQLLMTLGGLIVEENTEEAEKIKNMQNGLLKAIHSDAMEV